MEEVDDPFFPLGISIDSVVRLDLHVDSHKERTPVRQTHKQTAERETGGGESSRRPFITRVV